jgi:hypothetical protein
MTAADLDPQKNMFYYFLTVVGNDLLYFIKKDKYSQVQVNHCVTD